MSRPRQPWAGRADIASAWPAIAFATALSLIHFAGDAAAAAFVYDRAAVAAGESWRLGAGHLVHLGLQHYGWNVGTYLAIAIMARRTLAIGYGRQFAIMAVGAVTISLVLWLRGPGVLAYSGLSGVLNAMLAPILVESWRQTRDRLTLVVAALSIAKIAYEGITGETLFVDVPWPASAEAHAGGFGAGLLFAMVAQSLRSRAPEGTPTAPRALK